MTNLHRVVNILDRKLNNDPRLAEPGECHECYLLLCFVLGKNTTERQAYDAGYRIVRAA